MKSSLSDGTNDTSWKAITQENISEFHSLLSSIQTDKVQFIPLKVDIEKGLHLGSCNRIFSNHSNKLELSDIESYPNSPYDDGTWLEIARISSVVSEVRSNDRKGIKKIRDENIQVSSEIDGRRFVRRSSLTDENNRRYKLNNEVEILNEDLSYGINIKQSICLIPALLQKLEMSSHVNHKNPKKNDRADFYNSGATEGSSIHVLSPSLLGRKEVFPRSIGIHQAQGCNYNKNFITKHRGKYSNVNDQFSDQDCRSVVSKKLLTRIEKSFERIVRSIIVRNIDSVKQIGNVNPNFITRSFEKYLSEVLDCNAKILLGRKNLGLITSDDSLEDSFHFPESNMTCYLSVENPFSYVLYPSLVHDSKLNSNKTNRKYDGKPRTKKNNSICNCAQKNDNNCRIFRPQTEQDKDKYIQNKSDKNCELYNALNSISNGDSKVEPISKQIIKTGCNCRELIPENVEQNLTHNKIDEIFCLLMNGNETKVKKKCDCRNKNPTMTTIDGEDTTMRHCSCARKLKRKIKGQSQGRSKNGDVKMASKKQKCDCTQPCEPIAPTAAEGDQPRKHSCECVPDLKIKPDLNDSSIPPNSKLQRPCACKELIRIKPLKGAYISTNDTKMDKRMCSCLKNSECIKNDNTLPAIFSLKQQAGVGSDTDQNISMSTFASSELEKIASILKDTRQEILGQQNDDKLVSNIKCFRNSSGIICQSEIVGCSVTGGKCGGTNTIEIRIKYPQNRERNKEKSCASVCTNTDLSINYIKLDSGNKDIDAKYCEFFSKLQNKISCCAKSTISDISMLLDSLTQKDPVIYRTAQCRRSNSRENMNAAEKETCSSLNDCHKSNCLKPKASGDANICKLLSDKGINIPDRHDFCSGETRGICSLRHNSISCQTKSSLDNSKNKIIKCLFSKDKSSCSLPRRSSGSFEAWSFEDVKEEIQTQSCSTKTCRRLVSHPTPVLRIPKSMEECGMKGGCIREKLLGKFLPSTKQADNITPKNIKCQRSGDNKITCEMKQNRPVKDEQKVKKTQPEKNKSAVEKNKNGPIPSKTTSSSKNVIVASKENIRTESTTNKGEPVKSSKNFKSREKDGIKLDKFDQNILSHAIDVFLTSKKQ